MRLFLLQITKENILNNVKTKTVLVTIKKKEKKKSLLLCSTEERSKSHAGLERQEGKL